MAANQQTIEKRLAEFTEVHGTVLLGMHRELQSQTKSVNDRLEAATQVNESLLLLIEAHTVKIQATERRHVEDAERTCRELAELLERTRTDTKTLVDTADREANSRLQTAIHHFDESFVNFTRLLADSEVKILAYMVKQQQLLDAHAQEIRAMQSGAQQLLREIHQKIETHHQRELRFNHKLRQILLGLAIATSIAVIVGVWKPWIN